MKILTKEELMRIIDEHQKWLTGTGGNRADLSNADLSNANLSYANLGNANLSYANLNNANLSYANLFGADLSNADLSNANLSYANLFGADLSNADLNEANLFGADLSNANLGEADLSNADLTEARLSNANLTYANLSNAKGILNPIEYIMENFERNDQGIIVYKSFGEYYAPNPDWEIAKGSIIEEVVNPLPTIECGSGINVATKEWAKRECNNQIWKCLIRWEWLAGVIVPYQTDGKIRASKVQLIEPVDRL